MGVGMMNKGVGWARRKLLVSLVEKGMGWVGVKRNGVDSADKTKKRSGNDEARRRSKQIIDFECEQTSVSEASSFEEKKT